MTFTDELQSLINEVAKLRQENGELGEKLGAAYHRIGQLESALEHAVENAVGLSYDFLDKVEFLLEKRNKQNKQ